MVLVSWGAFRVRRVTGGHPPPPCYILAPPWKFLKPYVIRTQLGLPPFISYNFNPAPLEEISKYTHTTGFHSQFAGFIPIPGSKSFHWLSTAWIAKLFSGNEPGVISNKAFLCRHNRSARTPVASYHSAKGLAPPAKEGRGLSVCLHPPLLCLLFPVLGSSLMQPHN